MFFTLIGPGCQFTNNDKAHGTLWLMLDQSSSMAQLDPQATQIERLRWADALGLLPTDMRASPLGRLTARLSMLRADLAQLQIKASTPAEDAEARYRVDQLSKALRESGMTSSPASPMRPRRTRRARTIPRRSRHADHRHGRGQRKKVESRSKPEQGPDGSSTRCRRVRRAS